MMKPKKSKLDEPLVVAPAKAMENLDRMFDQVVSVSNKTVQARMKRAKQRNTAKRRRHSNPVTKR